MFVVNFSDGVQSFHRALQVLRILEYQSTKVLYSCLAAVFMWPSLT